MSAQGSNLAELEAQARDDVADAGSAQELAEVRASYLGRKGSVAGVLRTIGSLAPEERGRVGKEANEVKARRPESRIAKHRCFPRSIALRLVPVQGRPRRPWQLLRISVGS